MDKKKNFLIEGIIYQIIWIIASTALFIVVYKMINAGFVNDINLDQPLDGFHAFYFETGKYIMMIAGVAFIFFGLFFIQKKRFYKYNQYFESGLSYLVNDNEDLISFHESLSEERQLFIEIHNHKKELEKKYEIAYKEKTDLLTYLAHDIKTPIVNMIGYTTLLNNEKNLSEEQKNKFINIIYENAKYLNKLSEEFFSYLKFNLNDIPINLTNVNIKIFFRQWEEEKSLSMKNHLLVLEFLDIEKSEIKIDPQLILRIMENLITNAVNYSTKGTTIQVHVKTEKGILEISVINEISKDLKVDWSIVTSKFYRGDLSRRISHNGSGLGLTIVNDIVKHLDGNFEIGEKNGKVFAKLSIPYIQD